MEGQNKKGGEVNSNWVKPTPIQRCGSCLRVCDPVAAKPVWLLYEEAYDTEDERFYRGEIECIDYCPDCAELYHSDQTFLEIDFEEKKGGDGFAGHT